VTCTEKPLFGADSLLGHSYIFALAEELEKLRAAAAVGTEEDPYPVLLSDVKARGLEVSSAFWLETYGLTGGSKNQIDLSKSGQRDSTQGSIHYFLPSIRSDELSPAEEVTHYIDVYFQGKTYHGCEVKYYGGPDANHSWRLNLLGKTSDGERLSALGREGTFANCILVFLQTGPAEFTLAIEPKESLSALEGRSTFDTINNSSRKYGKIVESRITGNEEPLSSRNSSDCERILWRYGILPQFINTAASLGAEQLLDRSGRRDFVMGFAELSLGLREAVLSALDSLDEFLLSLQLRIQADGGGLSRTLIVVNAPSQLSPQAGLIADDTSPEPLGPPSLGNG
jgi:hypothetical protein